jgi:6-phosphogluconolactonase
MDRLSGLQAGTLPDGLEGVRLPDASSVARAAAEFIARTVQSVIASEGRCRVALAGGSTPRATYEHLAGPDLASNLDWRRVEIFFGDERMVPPEDAGSNYRMAREAFLDRVPIPGQQVHRIQGEAGAGEAARRYTAELGDSPLDLVILGMGDDGHVASLFPGSPALERPAAPVVPSEAPVPPHSRVTLSMPVINSASSALLIVTGAGKALRLKSVFDELREGRPMLPAARVKPRGGAPWWFVDDGAASLLGEAP